jgi:H+-translocating NAD(P) transhydrogenase subunit alpha
MSEFSGTVVLYIFLLAGIAGYMLISRVPSILHTALMSGSNFVHGIATVGAILALLHAETTMQISIAFVSLVLATANAVGGYVLTDRILALFESSTRQVRDEANQLVKTSVEMLDADVDFINVPEQSVPRKSVASVNVNSPSSDKTGDRS